VEQETKIGLLWGEFLWWVLGGFYVRYLIKPSESGLLVCVNTGPMQC